MARLLVLAVLVLASRARPADGATSRPRPSASSVRPTPPAPGTTTPPSKVPGEFRFTAPRLGGGTIRGADFASQDLVMWFWAPW